MAAKLPARLQAPFSKAKMTMSRLPLSSSKETKLKFNFRARVNKGAKSKEVMVDLTFFSPVSKKTYRCVLCHNLQRDPCQVTCCSSYYCRECIDSLSTTSGKCASKNCGKNYSIITDGATVEEQRRKVLQLKVHCLARNSGCKWVGTIEQLEQSHLASVDYDEHDKAACEYQDVKCPNECGATVVRGQMAQHRHSECARELSVCEFCGMKDSGVVIHKVHQMMCPSMPVECPKKCGTPGIPRSEILSHLENDCPLRLLSCAYRHVGCEEQVLSSDLDKHNTTSYQKHLDLMSEKLEFVRNENDELRGENDQLQGETTMLLSKLRDFKLGLSSVEDILDCYATLSSARDVKPNNGSEHRVSPCSSGSIDTLIDEHVHSQEGKSGYGSVINELANRMSSEKISGGSDLVSTSPESQDSSMYVNVRAGYQSVLSKTKAVPHLDDTYEAMPDIYPDVPSLQDTSESSVPLPASTRPRGRSSLPSTVGDETYVNVKRNKTPRSISIPVGSTFVTSHSPHFRGEMSLSSIYEDLDGLGMEMVKGTSYKSRPDTRQLQAVNPVTIKGKSDDSCPDSGQSTTVEENSDESFPDSGLSGTPEPDEDDDKKTKASHVTFQANIEVISTSPIDITTPVDDQEKNFTGVSKGDDAQLSQTKTTASLEKKSGHNGEESCSSAYAISIMRPRSWAQGASTLKNYNRKFSGAFRNPIYFSSSSSPRRPPPPPPKTSPGPGTIDMQHRQTKSVSAMPALEPLHIKGPDSMTDTEPEHSPFWPVSSKVDPIPVKPPIASDVGPKPVSVVSPSAPRKNLSDPNAQDENSSEAAGLVEPLSASLPSEDSVTTEAVTSNSESQEKPALPQKPNDLLSRFNTGTSETPRPGLLLRSTCSLPAHDMPKEIKIELKKKLKKWHRD